MTLLRALLGLAFFCAVAWLLSSHRRRFPWRVALLGIALQLGLGWFLFESAVGRGFFAGIAAFVTKLTSMNESGAELVFGALGDPARMGEVFGPESAFVFAFAGRGLVLIIFFSALMGVLYHLGIMQVVIWLLARAMTFTLGVSGAEAMAMAANVFVGNTEAPLVVRPYVPRMTTSELNALMTGGFATIAGTVLAIYMGFLGEELGPHLLSASVLSAPAAFVLAKIMQPEVERPETAGRVELRIDRTASNVVEAATDGTTTGLKLYLNVMAMLIAFMGLVAVVNWPLAWIGEVAELEGGLSLQRLFGWVFAPIAWMMGVEGWHDSQLMGTLLGVKVAVTEFVAFSEMSSMIAGDGTGFTHPRTAVMAIYALCGFANFGAMGIQIGGISVLAPERKTEISRLALRAMVGGAFASWMTATVAGIFA